MLDGRAGVGSDRLKSMPCISEQLEATGGELYGIEAHLEVSYHSVQRKARSIQNGVVCVEVDQRITSSKSSIIDVYREESRSEN